MRTIPSILLAALSAVLLACGGAETADGPPVCGGGFAEETLNRYHPEQERECTLVDSFSGVVVLLPSLPNDREWVLSGKAGDEPFTCTKTPGMVEGDHCSDNPKVEWFSAGVRLHAHPCALTLRLEVAGEPVAEVNVEPDYEWSEPNGAGCGWAGRSEVVLSPAEG